MVGNGSRAEWHSTTSASSISQRTVTPTDVCSQCFASVPRNVFEFWGGEGLENIQNLSKNNKQQVVGLWILTTDF